MVPRYAGPADLRPAAAHRRGQPGRRRRARRALRQRRQLPARRAVRPRRTSASPRGCCGPTTRRWQRLPVRDAPGGRRRRPGGQPVQHRRGHHRHRARGPGPARARRRSCSPWAATTPSRCRCCAPWPRAHGPVAVVHFDAHLDTWDTYFGAAVHARHAVPPGRRGGPAGPVRLPARRASAARCTAPPTSTERHRAGLPDRVARPRSSTWAWPAWSSASATRVGDRPVYVSVDIDVLDPAHAPGTGTPEAGGLTAGSCWPRCARSPG